MQWTTRAGRGNGERGGVMLAVLVITAATLAAVVTFQSVVSGFSSVRVDQTRNNAFQFANAGIDQALFRVDSQTLPTGASGTYVPTVVNGEVTSFAETVDVGGSSFDIVVSQDPVGQNTVWKVRATGTDPSGRQRLAVATIEAVRLFENGFFTINDFSLTGNQDSPVAYYSSVCVDPRSNTACWVTPAPARLGTNAVFQGATATMNALIDDWGGFNMYGRATLDAANDACFGGACLGAGGQVFAITDQLEINVPEPPAGVQPCPSGGNITSTIAPGDYACNDLTLYGTVNVSGTGNARFWIDGALIVENNAVVNRAQRPQRLQFFQQQSVGGTEAEGGEICGAEIWGLLYTPALHIHCNGSHQPEIFGSVVANLHDGTGNHFKFHWDITAQDSVNTGKYVVRDWRECPPGTTTC